MTKYVRSDPKNNLSGDTEENLTGYMTIDIYP
jgi:hypothetical protein